MQTVKKARDLATTQTKGRWLLLVHQLPASPSRARVKTWRRLQQLGAVAIRNAVYVLPDSAQSREDFEWLKAEVVASRGEASVFAADTIDSLTHDDIVSAFRTDREQAYRTLTRDARKMATGGRHDGAAHGDRQKLRRTVRQLRERMAQIVASDFFAAGGRDEAEAALSAVEQLASGPPADLHAASLNLPTLKTDDYRGKTWVTRPRPGIDRSGSAWLIRRFIDADAKFIFGEPAAHARAIPFDTYDVEFSHQGDRCTFEVLRERFAIGEPPVAQLARLVHDLDLKERRYNIPEAPAVGRLIDGLRQIYPQDDQLLEQGIVLFEALYRAYSHESSVPARGHPTRRSPPSTRKKGR